MVKRTRTRKPKIEVYQPKILKKLAKKPEPESKQLYISLTEAIKLAKDDYDFEVSKPTLLKWCKDKGIARQLTEQPYSKWHINRKKFIEFLTKG